MRTELPKGLRRPIAWFGVPRPRFLFRPACAQQAPALSHLCFSIIMESGKAKVVGKNARFGSPPSLNPNIKKLEPYQAEVDFC